MPPFTSRSFKGPSREVRRGRPHERSWGRSRSRSRSRSGSRARRSRSGSNDRGRSQFYSPPGTSPRRRSHSQSANGTHRSRSPAKDDTGPARGSADRQRRDASPKSNQPQAPGSSAKAVTGAESAVGSANPAASAAAGVKGIRYNDPADPLYQASLFVLNFRGLGPIADRMAVASADAPAAESDRSSMRLTLQLLGSLVATVGTDESQQRFVRSMLDRQSADAARALGAETPEQDTAVQDAKRPRRS